MRSSRLSAAFAAALTLLSTAAHAAAIDMDDPRRAVGRENDVRVDAQLVQDTVSPGAPVGITYQIQNFTNGPVALAHKEISATYDEDSRTITLAVGAEVPPDGRLPHLITIAPGEKKVFRAGATPVLSAAATRARMGAGPQYVQVKVSILRDLGSFASLIEKQDARGGALLSDALFDLWFEAKDTIFLNVVPVRFAPGGRGSRDVAGADTRFSPLRTHD